MTAGVVVADSGILFAECWTQLFDLPGNMVEGCSGPCVAAPSMLGRVARASLGRAS